MTYDEYIRLVDGIKFNQVKSWADFEVSFISAVKTLSSPTDKLEWQLAGYAKLITAKKVTDLFFQCLGEINV